jgi:beta-barrel assembly-enhancing protease
MIMLALTLQTCAPSGGLNLFGIQDDIKLGQQLRDEISKNPKEYPQLDRNKYAKAYQHLQRITDNILNSGAIRYRNEFEWKLHIIHDDKTLNAFVSPGGYIYVYTGLIKYLETEDELAGVMGHEIAHADRRHSTTNLTKQYGVGVLLSVLSGGNPNQLGQILAGVIGMKFSRGSESDADAQSVLYLSKTSYSCVGTAGFFEKMIAQGGQQPPQWLSTHPSHENRVNDIKKKAKEIGCNTAYSTNQQLYQELKRSLPQ